jgi:hypothetical protein
MARRMRLTAFAIPDLSDAVTIEEIVAAFDSGNRDVFVEFPDLAHRLYFLMLDYRTKKVIPVVELSVNISPCKMKNVYYTVNPELEDRVRDSVEKLEEFRCRAEELGGQFGASRKEISPSSVERLIELRSQTANRSLRASILMQHVANIVREYSVKRNVAEAMFNADMVYGARKELGGAECNNVGYLYFSRGRLEEARELFSTSIEHYRDKPQELGTAALPRYNLAILNVKEGRIPEAMQLLKSCINDVRNLPQSSRSCVCLHVLEENDCGIEIRERIETLDLYETAVEGLRHLEAASSVSYDTI